MDQINYGTYIMSAQAGLDRQVSLYTGITFQKNVTQIKHKIPISKHYVSWGFGD
jgi:hypothetical protein